MSKRNDSPSTPDPSHAGSTRSRSAPPPIETVADLVAAAARHGVWITSERPDFDRSGLDFLVVHGRDDAGTPWVVRTPRRPDVVATARIEARALRLVRSHLPVAVPDWQVHADDVIAYPRLGGLPAVTFDPATGVTWNVIEQGNLPDAFLDSVASALAALQSIAPADAERAGVPTRTIRGVRDALGRSMDATRDVLAPPEHVWRRWRRWLDDDGVWPHHVALVHGDLHPGHMLLDDDGHLTGILDWTDAQVTDPLVDLAMFLGCFGRTALEALVPRFERLGGRTWPRLVDHAAERWAAFSVLGAEWALHAGNQTALEHSRGQLATVAAEVDPG